MALRYLTAHQAPPNLGFEIKQTQCVRDSRAVLADPPGRLFLAKTVVVDQPPIGVRLFQCVQVFDRIARRIERSGAPASSVRADLATPRQKLVKSAVVLAEDLEAEAILVFTIRGNMARQTASFRPFHSRVFAICEHATIAQSLSLNWGIESWVMPFPFLHDKPEQNIEDALKHMAKEGLLQAGSQVVIISSITAGDQIVDVVEMRIV